MSESKHGFLYNIRHSSFRRRAYKELYEKAIRENVSLREALKAIKEILVIQESMK